MSPQRFPRAVDLATLYHCSACGETDPIAEDGYTACCNKRACNGMGPDAQDACCSAVQERLEYEAAHGTPPAPARHGSPPPPPRPARKRNARRSPQAKETRGLHSVSGPANLVSHQGGAAPTPPEPKEPDVPLSTAAATSAVCRNLYKDGPNSFEPVGHGFSRDRATYEERAKAYLKDNTRLRTSTIENADWDEVFATFVQGKYDAITSPPATPQPEHQIAGPETDAPAASGWDSDDRYMGYDVLAAAKGRVWHIGRRNDETVCYAKTDGRIGLSEAAAMPLGVCAKCSRYLHKHGAYVAPSSAEEPAPAPAPAAPAAPRKGARQAQGAASAPGWELLYDKPKAGCEVGRRYVDGKPQYALICKAHGHVHPLARLSDEGKVRKAGGWCPGC